MKHVLKNNSDKDRIRRLEILVGDGSGDGETTPPVSCDPTYTEKTTFFFDELNGDDKNDGLTSGSPLKTLNGIYSLIEDKAYNLVLLNFASGRYSIDGDPLDFGTRNGTIIFVGQDKSNTFINFNTNIYVNDGTIITSNINFDIAGGASGSLGDALMWNTKSIFIYRSIINIPDLWSFGHSTVESDITVDSSQITNTGTLINNINFGFVKISNDSSSFSDLASPESLIYRPVYSSSNVCSNLIISGIILEDGSCQPADQKYVDGFAGNIDINEHLASGSVKNITVTGNGAEETRVLDGLVQLRDDSTIINLGLDEANGALDVRVNNSTSLTVEEGRAPTTQYQPVEINDLTRKDYVDGLIGNQSFSEYLSSGEAGTINLRSEMVIGGNDPINISVRNDRVEFSGGTDIASMKLDIPNKEIDFKVNEVTGLTVGEGVAPKTPYQPVEVNDLTRKDYVDSAVSSMGGLFSDTKAYKVGDICTYDSGSGLSIYICTVDSTGAFDVSNWGVSFQGTLTAPPAE